MRALAATLAALAVFAVSCTSQVSGTAAPFGSADMTAIRDYFDQLNAAGKRGPQAQSAFLDRTQHPDYADRICNLAGLTLDAYPAMSTLRGDPKWAPEGGKPPRGTVYAIAVSLTIRKNGAGIGEQIGTNRVVLLDDEVYGFAPCQAN
ncbi:hypothetical protein EV191_103418 [Tamaricihabitans halophyticus]|uniref:Lipoprotein n=1 Tax=Tamaricihabitans halophyticus TaxID=1262583 RepID=A0A4R2QWA8_9PSEU|nr:hypothetical protein [Tamaricihabitans halophyticus]TCP54373.1 hypothetical protein EV191_103418 [Tamaricihabitans halophyticus]